MFPPTKLTVPTEALIEPLTLIRVRISLNMQKQTFVVTASPVLREEPALRHPREIVFMQILTPIVLFAEFSQPVLADHTFYEFEVDVGTLAFFWGDVGHQAGCLVWTLVVLEFLAVNWDVFGEFRGG